MIVCVLLTNIVGGVVWVMYSMQLQQETTMGSIVAQDVAAALDESKSDSSLGGALASSSMSVKRKAGASSRANRAQWLGTGKNAQSQSGMDVATKQAQGGLHSQQRLDSQSASYGHRPSHAKINPT